MPEYIDAVWHVNPLNISLFYYFRQHLTRRILSHQTNLLWCVNHVKKFYNILVGTQLSQRINLLDDSLFLIVVLHSELFVDFDSNHHTCQFVRGQFHYSVRTLAYVLPEAVIIELGEV